MENKVGSKAIIQEFWGYFFQRIRVRVSEHGRTDEKSRLLDEVMDTERLRSLKLVWFPPVERGTRLVNLNLGMAGLSSLTSASDPKISYLRHCLIILPWVGQILSEPM